MGDPTCASSPLASTQSPYFPSNLQASQHPPSYPSMLVSTMSRQYTLCARRNAATLAPRKRPLLLVEPRSARASIGFVNFQILLTTSEGESSKLEPKNSPRELDELTDSKT